MTEKIATGKPVVSIGMPVYNGEAFIREAVDSLLAQTFTDFELIISDNASTDGTEMICREYTGKDPRVRYVRWPENRGAAANFKFVLDEGCGKYFMWAAADDIWSADWIETLLPISIKYDCLSYGTVVVIDDKGEKIFNPSSGRSFKFSGPRIFRRLKYLFYPSSKGKANPIYGIVPRRFFLNSDFRILDEGKYGSDMVFLFSMLNLTEIRRPKKEVYLYKRIHELSTGGGNPYVKRIKKRRVFRWLSNYCSQSIISTTKMLNDYKPYTSFAEYSVYRLARPFLIIQYLVMGLWFHLLADNFRRNQKVISHNTPSAPSPLKNQE